MGYVGVDSAIPPTKSVFVGESYDSVSLPDGDLFLQMCSLARVHGIWSEITVWKGGSFSELNLGDSAVLPIDTEVPKARV